MSSCGCFRGSDFPRLQSGTSRFAALPLDFTGSLWLAGFVFLMALNMEGIWGFFTMPLGVLICFGPVLVVWLRAEWKAGRAKDPNGKDKH